MKLEQHILTRIKGGYSTISPVQDFNKEALFKLEKYSLYILPANILYDEKKHKPRKFNFYPLDEKRLVVGRAICIGRDGIDRPGTYLFHNFVISKEDLKEFDYNPVQLIHWLTNNKKFLDMKLDYNPEQPFTEKKDREAFLNAIVNEAKKMTDLEIPCNEVKAPDVKFPQMSRDLIMKLLSFCSYYETIKNPLSLVGTDKECLAFLGWLYSIIPYNLRERLSFDTYSYGTNFGINIIGIPDGAEFQQSTIHAMRLNLSNQHYTVNSEMKEPSQLISFIADMAATGRIDEINALYQLESLLNKGDYSSFKEGYKAATARIQDFVYTSQRKNLWNYVAAQKDVELLNMLTDKIAVEDITTLSAAPDIIHELVKTEDKRITAVFLDWFMKQTRRSPFYQFLFEYPHLLDAFLEGIKPRQQDIPPLLEVLKAFPTKYSEPCETSFLDKIIQILPLIREDKKLTKEFVQVFSNFPQTTSEDILLMRTFVNYELTDDPSLLRELMNSDTTGIPERYKAMMHDSMIKGMFSACKPAEIQGYFSIRFDKALDKQAYISDQFDSLERFEIAEKRKKILKEIFIGLLEELPPDEKIERLKGRIENFVGQKSSFLGKIFG